MSQYVYTMSLLPGLYKVKFNRRFHLMRVGVVGGKKVFKLDHGPYEPIEKLQEMDEYLELICQVSEGGSAYYDIKQARITISWQDSEEREFRMTVRDVWSLRNILQEFPFLKIPFNYLPRRKR